VSEDYDKKEKLLVLVHGSGVVKAGQWARRYLHGHFCLSRQILNFC
jgi:hypothetical protein